MQRTKISLNCRYFSVSSVLEKYRASSFLLQVYIMHQAAGEVFERGRIKEWHPHTPIRTEKASSIMHLLLIMASFQSADELLRSPRFFLGKRIA